MGKIGGGRMEVNGLGWIGEIGLYEGEVEEEEGFGGRVEGVGEEMGEGEGVVMVRGEYK